jgi:predicted nucleic acid-binding protein
MRFSVDTNVLVYAAVRQSGPRHLMAIDVMRRASGRDCVVTLQALGELFRALTGKFKVPLERQSPGWMNGAPRFLWWQPTRAA